MNATTTRTRYVVTTNGVDLTDTYASKGKALETAQAYVWAAERMARDSQEHVHTVSVRTVRTGKIVFERSVTVPALSVEPVQEPVQTTVSPGTYYPNVPGARSLRDARPLYVGDEHVSVGVQSDLTAYIHIGCRSARNGWGVDVSGMSYAEFYAWVYDVVTTQQDAAPVSALCPDIHTGCSHTMAMNEDGHGVACVEYADAHGIEWRQTSSPQRDAGVAAAIFLSAVRIARQTPDARSITSA
jgi:hypothetical protein